MDVGQLAGLFSPQTMLGAYNAIPTSNAALANAQAEVEQKKALAQQYLAQSGAMNQETKQKQMLEHLLVPEKQADIQKAQASAQKDMSAAMASRLEQAPALLTTGLSLLDDINVAQKAARGGNLQQGKEALTNLDSYVTQLAVDGIIAPEIARSILSKNGGAKVAAYKQLHTNIWKNAPKHLQDMALEEYKQSQENARSAARNATSLKAAEISKPVMPKTDIQYILQEIQSGNPARAQAAMNIMSKWQGMKEAAKANAQSQADVNFIGLLKQLQDNPAGIAPVAPTPIKPKPIKLTD